MRTSMMGYAPIFVAMAAANALAASATFVAPDGTAECTLSGIQVTANGNATMTVTGCAPFTDGPPTEPPPPPPPPPTTGDVVLFDLTPDRNRVFVPGCIDGRDWRTTDCEYNGSAKYGRLYAARFQLGANDSIGLKLDRAETGEDSAEFLGVVSTSPGLIYSADGKCVLSAPAQSVQVADAIYAENSTFTIPGIGTFAGPSYCVMPSGVPLYLTFTPVLSGCGENLICRAQLVDR